MHNLAVWKYSKNNAFYRKYWYTLFDIVNKYTFPYTIQTTIMKISMHFLAIPLFGIQENRLLRLDMQKRIIYSPPR